MRHVRASARIGSGLVLSLAAACGGGHGGAGAPLVPAEPVEVLAPPVPEAEGYIIDAANVTTGVANVVIGDNANDEVFVGILSFDLTGIGAVTKAELTLWQGVNLGDPFALGDLVLDHVDLGAGLDPSDATSVALAEAAATLTGVGSWSVDVGALVAADVAAGRTRSSFRLRFVPETDLDADFDYLRIMSSTSAFTDARPTLFVTHVP